MHLKSNLILISLGLIIWPSAYAAKVSVKIDSCKMIKVPQLTAFSRDCMKPSLIEKTIELKFKDSPIGPVVEKKEAAAYHFLNEERNGFKFSVAAWNAAATPLNQNRKVPVVSVQMMDRQSNQLQYSEISFFPERPDNFIYLTLYTDPKTNIIYSAEVRQID